MASPKRNRGALILAFVMLAPYRLGAQKPEVAGSVPTIRTEVDLLSVAVRVTDRKDNEIHGLRADQFLLFENGVPQKIAFFDAGDEPVSLGILLDVSGSMEATGKLDIAKASLACLLATMRPADEMFYLRFSRQVEKVVDFTSDPQRILAAISATTVTKDGTSLYDAIASALCYMRNAHHHKRALLVLTDGADQNSHRSLEDLVPIVQESQAQVFMILGCFGKAEYDLYRNAHGEKIALVTNQEIDNPLSAFKRLATESGAEAFFPKPDKLQDAVDAVARQLRTQYTLAYYPSASKAGFREIKVKVAQSGARVRARRGFVRPDEAVAGNSPEPSGGCENEKLKPYPYESKVTLKNGLTIYRDDFRDKASGWPNRKSLHYADGAYMISSVTQQPDEIFLGSYGDIGSPEGGAAAGLLVGNGPWFEDLDASVSVELKSGDNVAAGLVFRLNERGYYAVIIGEPTPGSRAIAFKLVKKYHADEVAQDLLSWTEVPVSDQIPGPQKKITVQCRGAVIKILFPPLFVTKFEDDEFKEGMVGMILYGKGRAVFQNLSAEGSEAER
jgi:Ca-activated chloride channel family protein